MCTNNNLLGNNINSCNNPNMLNVNTSCGCDCNGNNSCECNNCNNNTGTLANNITNNNLQENLRNFIGRRVTLEFNICGQSSKKTGVLSCVGCNFVTLRGVNNNNCLLADTNGLTFITVHNC